MRSKDTEFAAVKLPRCPVCVGVGKALKLTYTQTHSAGPCRRGSGMNLMHGFGEGGSGEKQGEKK